MTHFGLAIALADRFGGHAVEERFLTPVDAVVALDATPEGGGS